MYLCKINLGLLLFTGVTMGYLIKNQNLTAGVTRYKIDIASLEKRFNIHLQWTGTAAAGTNARIMFSDMTLTDAEIATASGVTRPELYADLPTITDNNWFAFVFPLYARNAWVEITTTAPLTGVNLHLQPISNTER
jgi:hypothetical protein